MIVVPNKMWLIVLLCFLCPTWAQDKPYVFSPESRQIDIYKGDYFYVGFAKKNESMEFDHCYIQSDSINVDYPITNSSKTVDNDGLVIKDESICGFYFYTDKNEVQSNFVITVHETQKQNFSESVAVNLYYNDLRLYLNTMNVMSKGSVVNFFITDLKLTTCTLAFDNTKIDLDMNSIKLYDNGIYKNRLTSFGSSKCGFRINDLVPSDTKELILLATDDQKKTYKTTTQLIVKDGPPIQNRSFPVFLGAKARMVCGNDNLDAEKYNQVFCNLFNPKGDLVFRQELCILDLEIVTLDDLGVWRCQVGLTGLMGPMEFTSELVEKRPESVTSFTDDSAGTIFTLGCQLVNYEISDLKYCKFTRPDGQIFTITTGSATSIYTSITTDLKNGRCAIEILKPLREEEKGSWKCEPIRYLSSTSPESSATGAFINVEKTSTLPYVKNLQKNIRLGQSFSIDCVVGYGSQNCFIIAPNGTEFMPDDRTATTMGLCTMNVQESHNTDHGTWQCSFAQQNGKPDEIITVEIAIIDVQVLYVNVEANENDNAELICNTNGFPLDYCRFQSPQGQSFYLRMDNSISNTRISYKGRGLKYGDCGLQIQNVHLEDGGEWHCHISPGRDQYVNKQDLREVIKLNVSPKQSQIQLAGSLGIAFGVVVAIIAIGGLAFYRKYRNRNVVHRGSGDTLTLQVQQNTYNTTA